jgi:hypothetical protein
VVPEERLELSRGYPHRILSPARLPFHHSGTRIILITKLRLGYKSGLLHQQCPIQAKGLDQHIQF